MTYFRMNKINWYLKHSRTKFKNWSLTHYRRKYKSWSLNHSRSKYKISSPSLQNTQACSTKTYFHSTSDLQTQFLQSLWHNFSKMESKLAKCYLNCHLTHQLILKYTQYYLKLVLIQTKLTRMAQVFSSNAFNMQNHLI